MTELCRRNVKLYHACQLKDLRSYLELGGVPSRNLLASKCLPFTPFDTDAGDQSRGVWNLVFFNLSDFGYWFAQEKDTLPNPFGPILLCFNPEVLEHANDISIALRSAGASDFDRQGEGISAEDVPRLFTDCDRPYVLFSDRLRDEFGDPRAQSPEISCSFDRELGVIDHLAYIRVDPYNSDNYSLLDAARQMVSPYSLSHRVYPRDCSGDQISRYRALWDAITRSACNGGDVLATIAEDPVLSAWAHHICSQDLSYQLKRYATYLFDGTVSECLS